MAVKDKSLGGYRVFVGDIGNRVGKYDLEKEFDYFGPLVDVWVARNPPGFAFVTFKYADDAEKVVKDLDGHSVCGRRVRVEHARPFGSGGRRDRGPPPRRGPPPKSNARCYECGGYGHFARDCRRRRHSRSRSRSRSRRSRSKSRSRRSRSRSTHKSTRSSGSNGKKLKRSKSDSRSRSRSRSPVAKKRSASRSRSRSGSKSPSRVKSKSVSRSRSRSPPADKSPAKDD